MKCIIHKDYLNDKDRHLYVERVPDELAQRSVNGGHYIYVPKNQWKKKRDTK